MIPPAELAELWQRHAAGLGLFVRVRGGADADDLLQEAFIRLVKQCVVPDDPLAWLAKTIRNLAIDQARGEQRRRKREELFVQQTGTRETGQDQEDTEWTADEAVAALANLDELLRDIVIAHLWNQMSFQQIAAAFEISSSTAHRKYTLAIEYLKTHLEHTHPSFHRIK